jgi:hypothetical protein
VVENEKHLAGNWIEEGELTLALVPRGTEAESKRRRWGRHSVECHQCSVIFLIYIFNCFMSLAVGLSDSDILSEKFV